MSIERPDAAALRDLAGSLGWFTLDDAQGDEFELLADAVLGVIDGLDASGTIFLTPPAADCAERDAGTRATPDDDPLHAVVRWCSVRRPSSSGLLDGLKVAVKDSIAVAGVPLTLGSAALPDFTPELDSVVAQRVLDAGGHIVATTNMDSFAFSGGADTTDLGWIANPYDVSRSAGGSSGGSAAVLSYSDRVDVAVGCDQGGSIRLPAAWCGVVGLKPTHGLVPYTGIGGIDATFDHAGPMARTTPAMARLLAAIAGPDSSDPRQDNTPHWDASRFLERVEAASDDLADVRIGVVAQGFSEEDDIRRATSEAVRQTVGEMAKAGAHIQEVDVPAHLAAGGIAFAGFIEGMWALLRGGGNGFHRRGRYWPEFAQELRNVLHERGDLLPDQIKLVAVLGEHLHRLHGGAVYARAQNQRPGLIAAIDSALADVDVLLMPTAPYPAYRFDESLSISQRVLRGWEPLGNTAPTDMSGHPAISVPTTALDGLPVGVMLIGRHFADAKLVEIANRIERSIGWADTVQMG